MFSGAATCLFCFVFFLAFSDVRLGRITEVRPNTPKHAVAVRCHKHGCSILKTARAFQPGTGHGTYDRIMFWLYSGRSLKNSEKAAHTRMYPVNMSL